VNNGYNHFVSTHAKVGLATMVLGMMAPIGGAVSFRKLGLLTLLPTAMQPIIKMGHRYVSKGCPCEGSDADIPTSLFSAC
jgi:hypothetical protein